jgi:acetyl-CoA/propionyl-CoA carboxylase biotin carboxyl carrier protein
MRTLRTSGIRSVAVFSDADSDARHVHVADVAFHIGGAAAADSYLRVDRVVEAALATGAEAVHPGYGFLSENAALARACADAGLVFVGPPASAIEAMGDKIRAKQMVSAAGVRVVPGSDGSGLSDRELAAAAHAVGYPVLLKPSAGGGGKGMRVVREAAGLQAEITAARREARSAFGDDTMLLERFVNAPRHIEIQVLADGHGNIVHLGERECSLQRRHQKIVEEAPSPLLTPQRRAAMGEQAVTAARACGYVNAGTVEFIVAGDRPDDAFFMEMNTRLQVEHPVTEMVWGLDLVDLQLRIAAGEALPFAQGDLLPRGHAVEARVYAEDPAHGFLPTGGRVHLLREPSGPHVRIDSGLDVGTRIGDSYDPMLAKVVAWGADRTAALQRLDRALAQTQVLGITTNIGFLRRLLSDPQVRSGDLHTGLVEQLVGRLSAEPVTDHVLAAAVLARMTPRDEATDPWHLTDGWRVGDAAWTIWNGLLDGEHPVSATVRGSGREGAIRIGSGEPCAVTATWVADELAVELTGRSQRFVVACDGADLWIGSQGSAWRFSTPAPMSPGGGDVVGSGSGVVSSPMPGVVVAVSAEVGAAVMAGQPLVVVEAMKMEHTILAPFDGVVAEVRVVAGQRVALRQALAVVERTGPATEEKP